MRGRELSEQAQGPETGKGAEPGHKPRPGSLLPTVCPSDNARFPLLTFQRVPAGSPFTPGFYMQKVTDILAQSISPFQEKAVCYDH